MKKIWHIILLLVSGIYGQTPYADEIPLAFKGDWVPVPESGELPVAGKYRVGDLGLRVMAVGTSEWMMGLPDTKEIYRPLLKPESLCARLSTVGHLSGSHWFRAENDYHTNELIFVGDGYRHFTSMIPHSGSTRGSVVISLSSEMPEGVPQCKGIVVTPSGRFIAWVGSGFLREIRDTETTPDKLEAVVDYWNEMGYPVGQTTPDRVLVLKEGDEFTVHHKVHGARRVVTANATGVVRCVGVYAPIPELNFRGGIGIVPVSLEFTSVNKPRGTE